MNVRIPMLVVGLILAAPLARADEVSDKVKERLGADILKLLESATKVEVFRIEAVSEAKVDEKNVAGHRIKAAAKDQDAAYAKKLIGVLTQEKSLFGSQARCFLPGVAFRLSKGEESIEVLVCFGCSNLKIIQRDAKGKVVKQVNGAFGPENGPLLKLAREAFPDDKELANVKEK